MQEENLRALLECYFWAVPLVARSRKSETTRKRGQTLGW